MKAEFNFNSQVCTDVNQSRRLLALGLKKETADMIHVDYGGRNYLIRPYDWLPTSKVDMEKYIPAWSMHRLIELLSTSLFPYRVIDNDFPLYDSLIARIEWQIEEGYFPKEYLYEKEKETF